MNRPAARTDHAWTVNRIAACIGMSPYFVRTEIHTGALKAVKFGRQYRVPDPEVARYLASKGWPVPAAPPRA